MTTTPSVFDLPEPLSAKRAAHLIEADDRHFAAIAESRRLAIAELGETLSAARRAAGGTGQAAMERDLEVHRLTARLRALARFGLDICLGRMVPADAGEVVHVGRLGLSDHEGRRLLVDWRSPAAEPFFGATHTNPLGLASRRRYRWTGQRITDYWDEVFTPEGFDGAVALDDQSAFIASLSRERSGRMEDVLGTIQADQDAIIRAGSRGCLVVDGGPGTGKTVVALHRTAYLMYSDPRLGAGRGGVLFVGPTPGYLSYIDDVLPSLGEDSVHISTLRDLVAEGAEARPDEDPAASILKSSARLVAAVDAAVARHERVPAASVTVETPWADVAISPAEWAEAFDTVEPGTAHNEAREQVWDGLLSILVDRLTGERDDGGAEEDFDAYGLARESSGDALRRVLAADPELARSFGRVWPLLEPQAIVARLWSDPAFLCACAPWLTPDEVSALQRENPRAWTAADLPFLDAAQRRVGDPRAARDQRRRQAALAAERERMSDVVDQLIASDDSELGVMSMLRGQDLRTALIDESAAPAVTPDVLAGPFAHIVVDEAQELTDAQWQMLVQRCPSRSFTIVGDRAQARHGFPESWQERLERVGLREITVASLTINYRTPREIMTEAEPVIRAAVPDANVPTSVRATGVPIAHGATADIDAIVADWLARNPDGVGCIIGTVAALRTVAVSSARIRALTPEAAKGLEFDVVVLLDPDSWGEGIEGAVDRYVAMTRATQRLVILGG